MKEKTREEIEQLIQKGNLESLLRKAAELHGARVLLMHNFDAKMQHNLLRNKLMIGTSLYTQAK